MKTLWRTLGIGLLVLGLVGCDHEPDDVSFPSEAGGSADAVDPTDTPQLTLALPDAVAKMVGDLSQTCGGIQREAAVLAQDVNDGLVDYQAEWDAIEQAEAEFDDAISEITGWIARLQSAIRSKGDVQSVINELPYDADAPTSTLDTFELLHDQLQNGSLEPPPFDFSPRPDSDLGSSTQAALLSGKIAPFLATHAESLVKALGALAEEVEDGVQRHRDRQQQFRDALAAEFDQVECDLRWPIPTNPTGLWTESSCARVDRPHSVVGVRVPPDRLPQRFSAVLPNDAASLHALVGRHGALVDAIGIDYNRAGSIEPAGPHGGTGGGLEIVEIAPGDGVKQVTIWHDQFINAIEFRTATTAIRFGSPSPTNASPNPQSTTFDVESGTEFAGLVGQYSEFRPGQQAFALNALGCVARQKASNEPG